jgi:hypothetical protein
VPTGETSIFAGWGGGNDATEGRWNAHVFDNLGTNFNGRFVQEAPLPGGGPDTCWFAGSAFAPFINITGGLWRVGLTCPPEISPSKM